MVPDTAKHLQMLAKGTQEWQELKASHTDAFLGDNTLLDKNDLTLLNQRRMSI